MGIDIASMDTSDASNSGIEIELRHPVTDAALGAYITVLGIESEIARDLRDAQTRKAQQTMQRAGRMVFDSPQALKDRRIDICVACTKSWRNMTYKGADLPFSVPNARMLYGQFGWMLNQVDIAIADIGNFLTS